jgi:hypothetical protein
VGAQNDAIFIINKPPRPSADNINPNQDVDVIAKVYLPDEANARLIAAAPDLLFALALLVDAVQMDVALFLGQPYKESRLGIAVSAIEKAIGRPLDDLSDRSVAEQATGKDSADV